MTRMISLIFACLTIAISGCASVDAAKSDLGHGTLKVFQNPYDEVWNAALKALPALGISAYSTNKSTGTIIGEKGVSAFSWGERVALHLTSDEATQTRVEVISKRAVVINVTATDWTQEIFRNIDAQLPSADRSTIVLQGAAASGYADFRSRSDTKAFAIADGGHWAAVWGTHQSNENAAKQAVESCQRRGFTNCKVYAINDEVVWTRW